MAFFDERVQIDLKTFYYIKIINNNRKNLTISVCERSVSMTVCLEMPAGSGVRVVKTVLFDMVAKL